ncbi:MAG: hypothetical protein MUC89_21475 [Acetobacteraceae bacterium]|nr:hypothetical protein [Acetobacteraceae bacterium]
MSSVNVIPAGFTALMAMASIAIVLGLAILVQRWRGRSMRGPLAAFIATALAYGLLVAADAMRHRWPAATEALRLADTWVVAWVPVALAVWWAAARR